MKKAFILAILLLMIAPPLSAEAIVIHNGALLIDETDHLIYDWYGMRFPAIEHAPMPDAREVVRAVRELDVPLAYFEGVNIYLLNRKMKGFRGIFFPPNTIILAGSHVAVPRRIHHFTIHELGHVVYERLTPWEQTAYRRLRGLHWYHERKYETRATEVFAEDFRLLFGGELAQQPFPLYWETLDRPCDETADFMRNLWSGYE